MAEATAAVSSGEGVAKALVGKLGQLLSDEYRLLRGVRGEVIQLKDEVAIMNALLRMLAEADDGAVSHFVREWMKQVRELTYDAEDCIDLFVRRISSVGCHRRAGALAAAWHVLATLAARHRLASDILALRSRTVAISERRARYGVDSQALRPSAYFAQVAVATTTTVTAAANEATSNELQLVGMEGQVKSMSERLNNKPHDKMVKVFSIVGFGGLGKTTLAKLLCRRLEEEFTCQATVSVSQAFDASKDMADLLKRILYQVVKVKKTQNHKGIQQEAALGNVDSMDKPTLTSNLKRHLKDKRSSVLLLTIVLPPRHTFNRRVHYIGCFPFVSIFTNLILTISRPLNSAWLPNT